ncbi:MAG: hypothetical protein Udaeo2_25580 [Candidatus Udaeobacter sp.]|nr:MAG: hypothetical protein Udaeo2_25580 [Candidatus Udaeobacter sp.]
MSIEVLVLDIQNTIRIRKYRRATIELDLTTRQRLLCRHRRHVEHSSHGWRSQDSRTGCIGHVHGRTDGVVRKRREFIRDRGRVIRAEETPHTIRNALFIQAWTVQVVGAIGRGHAIRTLATGFWSRRRWHVKEQLEMLGESHRLSAAVAGVLPRRLGEPGRPLEVELVGKHVSPHQYAHLHVVVLIRAHQRRKRIAVGRKSAGKLQSRVVGV